MTDEETLAEIERQEKRFADAGFGRGLRLAHSAREYFAEMMEMRRRALAAEEECREAEVFQFTAGVLKDLLER